MFTFVTFSVLKLVRCKPQAQSSQGGAGAHTLGYVDSRYSCSVSKVFQRGSSPTGPKSSYDSVLHVEAYQPNTFEQRAGVYAGHVRNLDRADQARIRLRLVRPVRERALQPRAEVAVPRREQRLWLRTGVGVRGRRQRAKLCVPAGARGVRMARLEDVEDAVHAAGDGQGVAEAPEAEPVAVAAGLLGVGVAVNVCV